MVGPVTLLWQYKVLIIKKLSPLRSCARTVNDGVYRDGFVAQDDVLPCIIQDV